MDSIIVINNMTIFSILKIILTYQDYRIAYIYTTDITKDISTKISEITWNHMVPVALRDLNKTEKFVKKKTEEQTLNVFAISNSSDIHCITRVKNYLQPNDVTVIFFNSTNSNMDQKKFQHWMKSNMKIFILWKTFLISVNQFDVDEMDKISIHPYNITATQRFIEDYLRDNRNAKGAEMTVFMHHFPPKSSVGPLIDSDDYTFNGPDGVVADVLFKTLNVNATYVTDVGLKFPPFKTWKQNPTIATRLHLYGYHKEATTSNVISRFDVP